MKSRHGMFFLVLIFGTGGAALLVTLLMRHGAADIVAAVETAGWGIAVVIGFQWVPMFFDVLTWRVLFPRDIRPGVRRLFLVHWIGDAVSSMLPVAQVGGELVRIRLISAERLVRSGKVEAATPASPAPADEQRVPVPIAAATVLVGLTIGVGTQIIFTLSGLAVLLCVMRYNRGAAGSMLGPVLIGSAIGVAAMGGFYAIQRLGIFRIAGVIVRHVTKGKQWSDLIDRGAVLDTEVRAMYTRRNAIVISSLWNMGTWISGVFEVWLGLWALGWGYGGGAGAAGGILNGLAQAYVLESMAQAIRSAAFLIPGALGVQEGGYLVVGGMLGIPAEIALALALIRRARELAFGVPGILAWQWLEGRWLLHRARNKPAAHTDTPAPPEALRAGG